MVLPRQFLKVSALRPYFPGGELNTFAPTPRIQVEYATPSSQRLLLGLLGYLIRFAPLAFVPHRQNRSSWTPSPQVVFLGLYHFTSSPKIPPASRSLVLQCLLHAVKLSMTISQKIYRTGYGRFRPSNAIATRGAGVTAAAGTRLTHHLFAKIFTLDKSPYIV